MSLRSGKLPFLGSADEFFDHKRASAVSTGLVNLPWGHQDVRPNKTSQGRKCGIRKLLAFRPWASLQDQQLFLCGWEAGREWALNTHGDPGEEPIGYSYSLDSLLAEVGISRAGVDVTELH
jgi:hypothetical protein